MGATSYGQVRDALLEIHSIASEYKIGGMLPKVEQTSTDEHEPISDEDSDDFDEEDEIIGS
jgi:hypothetical protein